MTGLLEQRTIQNKVVSQIITVDQAVSMLYLRDIIGNTNTGQQGVRKSHFQQWSKLSAAERRTSVQAKVRRTEYDQRKERHSCN